MSSVSAVNTLLGSTTTTSTPAVDVSSILAATVGATTPGIDVTAAVNAALYADRASERIWQADQATLSSQTTALTAIQTATTALATDMNSLNSLSGPLSARNVTSSNTSVVSATAASGTVAGTHTVSVANVATTGSWYSDISPSATAPLPSSTFTITDGAGGAATISTGVGGIDTLNALARAINAATDSSGKSIGVTASVVSDSSGSRLAIISNTSGTKGDFSITAGTNTSTAWTSASVATGTTPLSADSFVLTTGATGSTTDTTINVTAGQSFTDVANTINNAGVGVTASVVTDTNGAHLSIVSNDGTTPFGVTEPGFAYSRAFTGADANLTVDGVPITSPSNVVTGAIGGVTLNLSGTIASTTPVTLTVAADATQVSTAINQFVTDYNTAIGLVNAQFNYSASTGSEGVLGSDPTVRALQNTLMQAMNYSSAPTTGVTPVVSNLSDLGITMGTDGTLSIDSSTLNNVLVNSPSAVQTFLQGSALNGFASTLTTQLDTYTDPGNGAFKVDLSSISNTNTDLTKHISDYESLYIANQQTVLTAMYSAAEEALQSLPTQMAQISAELGNTKSGG